MNHLGKQNDMPMLIWLAYLYLLKKKRITHKDYTWADVFDVAERILQWAENTRGYGKKLTFTPDELLYSEKIWNVERVCV
jgi:hypothetical protein